MSSLLQRALPLADTSVQRQRLEALPLPLRFEKALQRSNLHPLLPNAIEIFQMNVGKVCNQTCHHCHVDAGPDREEVMSPHVVAACLRALERSRIGKLDITGGAPELHPQFREIVARAAASGCHVMDRCNLTILLAPKFEDLPEFLAAHRVEVLASLPSYNLRQTDAQRGHGVFERSLEALRRLNTVGYGRDEELQLNLVTNPVGAFLPASQAALEAHWKRQLRRRFDIEFNSLYTITNMPISRFLEYLVQSGNLDVYMERLVNAYNPAAAAAVMCRNTLSVGWDGTLFDCDFNQMLDLPVESEAPQTIFDFDLEALNRRRIVVGQHCFGCTAGAGSSCGGATAT
ncbi:MAG: arsenosugar biosynthesis radical SAM protein ArsS [Candidatus Latescibacterota bacterium]|nr:MAG: arsenosugar biosynthesis radical SAM protein ArsS [Candidatus Latescibacterota bacterium]